MPKAIKENQGREASRAGCEPLGHRGLVPAPDAASAARRQAIGRDDPGGNPGLHYAVKWKRPYYGRPELGWIIEMAAYDVSVNVVFLGGADFESPPTSRRRRWSAPRMEPGWR
jgi:hypothetical protein